MVGAQIFDNWITTVIVFPYFHKLNNKLKEISCRVLTREFISNDSIIGPLRINFSILDIFAVDMWNVHILVQKIVIREVETINEGQNAFSIFWSSNMLSWSVLAA